MSIAGHDPRSPGSGMPAFLRACRGERVRPAPVWMMRQAGRYLPEYRKLRARHHFLDLCKTPELAAEVTLQPVRRFSVDAAILFSDILIPLEPMGVGLRFEPGPILERPIRTEQAIASLRPLDAEEPCGFVMEAIRMLRRELGVPLIGFCGAPFTLAAYLAEGGGRAKASFDSIVRMMYERPELAERLLAILSDAMAEYLGAQVRAGAQAAMIFDSWAGILGPEFYARFALPAVQRIIARLPAERGPVIYFVLGGAHLLEKIAESDADVIGIDWRTSLSGARMRLAGGRVTALQGNLDPRALYAPEETLRREVRRVLREGAGGGHVFNLGHGILPDTSLASAERLVDLVHTLSMEEEAS
jgi:uroporphyrinogen decarboxylase